MKVVTTCHKAGFNEYGHRWAESIKNWPAGEFIMYCEGFGHTPMPARGEAFKAKHASYRPPSWRFDIVKFSNKVFAAYDALYNHDGLGVWLDADAVTYRPIPEGYIESLLPDGCYLAHFKRHHYTETGFWVMDCRHPEHKAFLDHWVGLFESDAFQTLPEWHDCTTLDATIKAFRGRVKTHSLSGGFEGDMNPMARVDLSRYVTHLKGPRKGLQYDPDNANAKAFFDGQQA